jgi:protein-tyrosine-phosphatase
MYKKRVLFVCVHNSARSQIAEAFLKQMAGGRYGFRPSQETEKLEIPT